MGGRENTQRVMLLYPLADGCIWFHMSRGSGNRAREGYRLLVHLPSLQWWNHSPVSHPAASEMEKKRPGPVSTFQFSHILLERAGRGGKRRGRAGGEGREKERAVESVQLG